MKAFALLFDHENGDTLQNVLLEEKITKLVDLWNGESHYWTQSFLERNDWNKKKGRNEHQTLSVHPA